MKSSILHTLIKTEKRLATSKGYYREYNQIGSVFRNVKLKFNEITDQDWLKTTDVKLAKKASKTTLVLFIKEGRFTDLGNLEYCIAFCFENNMYSSTRNGKIAYMNTTQASKDMGYALILDEKVYTELNTLELKIRRSALTHDLRRTDDSFRNENKSRYFKIKVAKMLGDVDIFCELKNILNDLNGKINLITDTTSDSRYDFKNLSDLTTKTLNLLNDFMYYEKDKSSYAYKKIFEIKNDMDVIKSKL
jgi:hypothetical protein